MIIRSATDQDHEGIIDLLRDSLGESTIPKSAALWQWKHQNSPFGPSYVLVAEEEGKLIGLRAFMRWQWHRDGKIYSTIRAVDTATHPAHQGKGIFKKLTLQQAQLCKSDGVQFIFNTPNDQSRPGYLKMGWVAQGKMPLKIKAIQPIQTIVGKLQKIDKYSDETNPVWNQKWTFSLFDLVNQYKPDTNRLTTVLSPDYISWRYANNPLFKYQFFTDYKNYIIITRIKNYGFARELRIADFILINPSAKKEINKHIKQELGQFVKEAKISFVSMSGQQYKINAAYLKWMGLLPSLQIGPIVTLKDLNMHEQFPNLLKIKNWGYSLGDMELF